LKYGFFTAYKIENTFIQIKEKSVWDIIFEDYNYILIPFSRMKGKRKVMYRDSTTRTFQNDPNFLGLVTTLGGTSITTGALIRT